MPPQRRIHADPHRIILSIYAQAAEQREAVLADQADRANNPNHRAIRFTNEVAEEEWRFDGWVRRDLSRFAGWELSPSERKRWQECVRQLEADGLVETYTVDIRLTPAGNALANKLNHNPATSATT